MSIAVKLELVFDSVDEVVELLGQLTAPMVTTVPVPQSTYQSRIAEAENRAQPLMDMLTAELARKGLPTTRMPGANTRTTEVE